MGSLTYAISILFVINNLYNHSLGSNVTHQNLFEDSGTIVNHENNNDGVSETQYATCRIATEELVANAQATVTRVLTGVCIAEAVDARFQNLESLIKREFDEVKRTLNLLAIRYEENKNSPDIVDDPRKEEIDRLNNTIYTVNTVTGAEKTFFYFMRVKDFHQKTSRWDSGWFERSPTFYLPLRGYAMYVKVAPRDIHGEITYVDIGAGLTRGIHDQTLGWPFSLKHQLEILDHSVQGFRRDLRSSIVNPPTTGSQDYWIRPANRFGNGDNREQTVITIPLDFIINDYDNRHSQSNFVQKPPKYLWNGDLTVKLTVYL